MKLTFIEKDDAGPSFLDFKGMRLVGEVDIIILSWLSRKYRSSYLSNSSRNYFDPFSFRFMYRNLVSKIFLVCWLTEFEFLFEIDPKLKANRVFIFTFWNFSMNDSFSSSHPLHISRPNFSLMPLEVFMKNIPLLHVSYGLKSSMRMVRKSCRKFNFEIIKH